MHTQGTIKMAYAAQTENFPLMKTGLEEVATGSTDQQELHMYGLLGRACKCLKTGETAKHRSFP